MATTFTGTISFTQAPHEVWAMITEPNYVVGKGEAQGALSVEASVTEDESGGAIIESRRSLPAELPSFARALVGETVELTEVQTWSDAAADGSRTATLTVSFGSSPVAIQGSIRLEPTPTGSQIVIESTAKSSVPFIGSKVEHLTRDQTLRAIAKEEGFAATWGK
jgi:hypothetical protein